MLKKIIFVTLFTVSSFYIQAADQKNQTTTAQSPYSKSITYNNIIFVSGQIGKTPQGNLADGIKGQTKQAIENLIQVLKESESDLTKVVKVNIYVKDIGNYELVNKIYSDYFTSPYPARTFVQVAKLPKDALIEIEAIAHK